MLYRTAIWTGWNNAGFCSFFTKKEPKKFQTKMGLLHKEKIQVQQPLYGYMFPKAQKRSP